MDNGAKVSLAMRLPGGILKVNGSRRVPVELLDIDVHPQDYIGRKQKSSKEANRIAKKFWAKIPTYEQSEAQKHLYLLRPAYEWMISAECPIWYSKGLKFKERDWKKLSEDERLFLHMKTIADENGAISFEYEVLED